MANILIAAPTPIVSLAANRGTGVANLLTPDPREVWLDSAVGSEMFIELDFGIDVIIDTVFLGCLLSAHPGATWAMSGGLAAYDDWMIKDYGPLRVPDRNWARRAMSHALWVGTEQLLRYLRIAIIQPDGASPLSIGALIAGNRFQPRYNKEWGSGRGVKDTGTVTRLASGGIASVEGVRYATYSWTLGDLSEDEADRLFELQLDRGESRPVLVVEDPASTAGLRNRIRYGALTALRTFERRNAVQTSIQLSMEDWAIEPAALFAPQSVPALTLGGVPLTLGGEILTLGE